VAALALRKLGYSAAGIATTRWPGRLELVAERPDILLDGAHNPAGANALAMYIHDVYIGRKIRLIYGVMRDKPVSEMTAELFPLAASIVVTTPQNSRAMPPAEVIREVAPHPDITTAPNIATALALSCRKAGTDDAIVITGSLFLVGEARALLVK
jgi:dihydrofolate synthase/folylpolyglutamate synthase